MMEGKYFPRTRSIVKKIIKASKRGNIEALFNWNEICHVVLGIEIDTIPDEYRENAIRGDELSRLIEIKEKALSRHDRVLSFLYYGTLRHYCSGGIPNG